MSTSPINSQALITGGAKRIGASIARTLHAKGWDIAITFRHSSEEASKIASELNAIRPASAKILGPFDITSTKAAEHLAVEVRELDLLVNNASCFEPGTAENTDQTAWQRDWTANVEGHALLSQRLAPALRARRGSIVNIVDIYADRPLRGYLSYSVSKAAMAALTRGLAVELAPEIRVNGVAPGPILLPDDQASWNAGRWEQEISRTLLQRAGSPEDVAKTVAFLAEATYLTGVIIPVDGGKSINA